MYAFAPLLYTSVPANTGYGCLTQHYINISIYPLVLLLFIYFDSFVINSPNKWSSK